MRSVSTSVPDEVGEYLDKQAESEKRSLSNMIRIILEGYVEERKASE